MRIGSLNPTQSPAVRVPQGSVLGPQEFIVYTEELVGLINGHHFGHHLYADDTRLIKKTRIADIGSIIDNLQQCIEAIHRWCVSRRLQLNPSKTEVIWLATEASLKKMENMNRTACQKRRHGFSSVRDLGVTLD